LSYQNINYNKKIENAKNWFFWICISIIILFIIIPQINGLKKKVLLYNTNQDTSLMEDRILFEKLKEYDLITILDDKRIDVKASDYGLFIKAEKYKNSKNSKLTDFEKEQINLIKRLYHTNAGKAVLLQIKKWNQSRLFCAVRDNRINSGKDLSNKWSAYETDDDNWFFQDISHNVPLSFGYVNRGLLTPGFNDWLAAHSTGRSVLFKTKINFKKSFGLKIQVVGTVKKFMDNKKDCSNLVKICDQSFPYASNIELKLEGEHDLKIIIEPVNNKDSEVNELNICLKKPLNKEKNNIEKIENISWLGKIKKSPLASSYSPLTITTSDNVILTNGNGKTSSFCESSGLLSLIGYNPHMSGTMYDMLARSKRQKSMNQISLTIDSRLQSIAQQTLLRKINEYQNKKWKNNFFSNQRRASVIILGLDDNNAGEILAAANLPQPLPGLHPWDIASFTKLYHKRNPFMISAWKGLDGNNAPGSTFKPVVSLCAISEANTNSFIRNYLNGYSRKTFKENTGLDINCSAYNPRTDDCIYLAPKESRPPDYIKNSNNSTLYSYFGYRKSSCIKNQKKKNVFGLHQAIRNSVNVWFVRLLKIIDGDTAIKHDNDLMYSSQKGLPDFKITQMAKKFGFGNMPFDLAYNLPFDISSRRIPYIKARQDGDVLYSSFGTLDIMDPKRRDYLWILSQNAIGQGMTASPLQMARICASINRNEIVMPSLFKKAGNLSLKKKSFKQLDINKSLINVLKSGMKAVPETGTASSAFFKYPGRCRIYGKTGTANTGKHKVKIKYKNNNIHEKNIYTYSAWFNGFFTNENNNKKIAFACMITHTYGNHKSGASVCAPVIKEILMQWEKETNKEKL